MASSPSGTRSPVTFIDGAERQPSKNEIEVRAIAIVIKNRSMSRNIIGLLLNYV